LTLRSLIDLATIRTVSHDKNLHIHLKGLSGVDY